MISQMNEQLRRIVLAGFIKEDTAAQFLEQVTALECTDMVKPISIYIDTYGGNVDAALCMYDTMKACCCPIVTVGIGKVMSAGVLLLAAGDKGNRFITENTRVMIHEISGGTFGPISELEHSLAESHRMQDVYVSLLMKDIGKTKTRILKDMNAEKYMSAAEAVKYGIADKLVPTRKTTRKVAVKNSAASITQKSKTKKNKNTSATSKTKK